MNRRTITTIVGLIVFVVAAAAFAQVGRQPGAAANADAKGRYRVTSWPEHTSAENRYADEVERYINRMASEGWRFHSTHVGQRAKMMVFERVKE